MKKNMTLLCLFLTMTVMSFAQIKQGKLTYSMEFSSDDPEMAMGLAMMQGSKMDMYFVPGKTRSEVAMGSLGTMTTIADEKAKKALMLMNMMGQKTATETTIEAPKAEEAPKFEIENTTETKEILGYKCTKAIMTSEDGTAITIWYTKDLEVSTAGQNYYNSQMPGFPMSINTSMSGMTVQLTVTALDKKTPDSDLFKMKVPEGYTVKTEEEMMKMGQ